jgi:putative DNA primase/helicase
MQPIAEQNQRTNRAHGDPMKPAYQAIPEELRSLPNWIIWRYEKRADKRGIVRETKVPYNAKSEKHALSNKPATWSGFGDAAAALKRDRSYAGLGFCLTPPYVGVDLDGCRQNGSFEPWADEIIRELDSYSEFSPSKLGVHVITKGELPDGPRQKVLGGEHHGVGLYDSARGRYLTVTGNRISGNGTIAERTVELQRIHARLFPPQPKAKTKAKAEAGAALTDDDLVERARNANDGGKFSRLWAGEWEGAYASQSEADLALSMRLAFWTNRDAARIDALFRRSGLMRQKWERADYRDVTIAKAIAQTTETWRPRGPDQRPWVVKVDPDKAKPSLELLNACPVFGGRIQFTGVKRRGPMIVATFGDGAEAIWPSVADLISFPRSQAIIGQATQVVLATPSRRSIKPDWEPAAQWILQLAGKDQTNSTDSLREEFRHIIPATWKRAGCPHVENDTAFLEVLQECADHRRDPTAQHPPRRCVWHDNSDAYVHQPSLIEWLSTPAGHNKQWDWGQVRNALLLLDFQPEQIHRSVNSTTAKVRLWRGPLDLLVDDET